MSAAQPADPIGVPAFGTTLIAPDRTLFRLWAPAQPAVSLEIEGMPALPMARRADGWFETEARCGAGALYRYRLSSGHAVPDPAARAQASDVHGPSIVIDPNSYTWRVRDWHGRPWHETVLYELHAGLLDGFSGVARELARLADLGITAIELMPIAEFPGRRNWGYDGVLPFAPARSYGTPDELKTLVDAAHAHGLMIRARRQLPITLRPRHVSQRRRDIMGSRNRFPSARGPPLLLPECGLLADRVSVRRAAPGCSSRNH